nr:hypothetical protein [Tanacetum cinerariifolium]
MAKLAFYDYNNMVAILEKTEHNTDFHQIVNFLDASHIRYALTISPTARIETTYQETNIIATVIGKSWTISKSSLRRHLKLNDEEGISSLLDAELFENLSLMGYNNLPNQSNIATAVVCLATNRVYNFSKMIFDGMMRNININSPSFSGRTVPLFASMIVTQGEGSANPTEPHHTPLSQEHHSPQHDSPPPSHQTIISEPIPQAPTETLTPRRYTRRAIRIAQSKALSPAADEPASLSRDDRQREAFPTVSSLDAGQDRENIPKTSALSHESSSRVPSLDADEGKPIQEDAPITGGIIDIREELGAEKSTEKGSNDTEEMINVLSSIEAANILSSGGAVASVSPVDVLSVAGVPTVSAIFTIASVVAREMEEEFARENQRLSEQLVRDYEIARLHTEEELKIMIEVLDMSNEVIAKQLSEYEQAEADLSVGEKIELISELVKYQDHRANILKYQAQQSKPLSKKEQMKFYMSFEDFIPMSSKEESERVKRQGLKIDQGSSKRMKIFKEELKGMMQLVPLEEVYIEALQQFDEKDLHQLWTLVKETFSIKQGIRDKEKELWVELKRLFEPDFEDQLWTHHQTFMHDLLD